MESDKETMDQKIMWRFSRRMLKDSKSFVRRPQKHSRVLSKMFLTVQTEVSSFSIKQNASDIKKNVSSVHKS